MHWPKHCGDPESKATRKTGSEMGGLAAESNRLNEVAEEVRCLRMMNLFRVPVLTRGRIVLAFTVALAADAIQLALGPLGWTFFDEVIDVFAMAATTFVLGFHPLLLPTFIVEFIPVVDMLPTWTGCVSVIVLLRKRQESKATPGPARDMGADVIDV
jgi:hypothetical protein